MSIGNTIPIKWDTGDGLLGKLFPAIQGPSLEGIKTEGGLTFPSGMKFSSLSPQEIGSQYYGNKPVYDDKNSKGVKVYSDEPLAPTELEEVNVYGNDFYKDFDRFSFTLFTGKDGALLLKQYEECSVFSDEIALFVENTRTENYFGGVVRVKCGSALEKINLPIAEMISFMRTHKVDLSDKVLTDLIQNGKYKSKEGLMSFLYSAASGVQNLAEKFVVKDLSILNGAMIRLFESLYLDETRWNSKVEGYSPLFITEGMLALLENPKASEKLSAAITKPFVETLKGIAGAGTGALDILQPILPKYIYEKLRAAYAPLLDSISAMEKIVRDIDFLTLLKTGIEMANAYLCGVINGIIDFVKGFFDLIGLILTGIEASEDVKEDPFFHLTMAVELIENVVAVALKFNFLQFMFDLTLYPLKLSLELAVKLASFVRNADFGGMKVDFNLSKIGYIWGYVLGLIASVIIDAFLTGGYKSVEDIFAAISKFISEPKASIKTLLTSAEKTVKATIAVVYDFVDTIVRALRKGATKLFEDFKGFVESLIKKLEELLTKGNVESLNKDLILEKEIIALKKLDKLFFADFTMLLRNLGVAKIEKEWKGLNALSGLSKEDTLAMWALRKELIGEKAYNNVAVMSQHVLANGEPLILKYKAFSGAESPFGFCAAPEIDFLSTQNKMGHEELKSYYDSIEGNGDSRARFKDSESKIIFENQRDIQFLYAKYGKENVVIEETYFKTLFEPCVSCQKQMLIAKNLHGWRNLKIEAVETTSGTFVKNDKQFKDYMKIWK